MTQIFSIMEKLKTMGETIDLIRESQLRIGAEVTDLKDCLVALRSDIDKLQALVHLEQIDPVAPTFEIPEDTHGLK